MKKIISMLFISIVFIACKKQYSCRCTTTITRDGITTDYGSDVAAINENMTKKQAQATCDHEAGALRTTYRNIYFSTTFTNSPIGVVPDISTDCLAQ